MKAALLLLIEGVAILFGAFGGYLNVVAPPPGSNTTLSAAGLASFAALIIFAAIKLFIIALNDDDTNRLLRWGPISIASLSGVIFLWLSLDYFYQMDRYTFMYPSHGENSEIVLVSDDLTTMGKALLEKEPDLSGAHPVILDLHDGMEKIHEIWTAKGIVEKRQELNRLYVYMVLFLCISIGFSIEGTFILSELKKNASKISE